MDWVVGITTLCCMELNMRKKWWSFLLATANQVVWTTFIISKEEYGLLPLNIALYVMNYRGAVKWRRLHLEGRL